MLQKPKVSNICCTKMLQDFAKKEGMLQSKILGIFVNGPNVGKKVKLQTFREFGNVANFKMTTDFKILLEQK